MLIIETPTGSHHFNDDAELDNHGGNLKTREEDTLIAVFRDWTNWRIETTQKETQK